MSILEDLGDAIILGIGLGIGLAIARLIPQVLGLLGAVIQ